MKCAICLQVARENPGVPAFKLFPNPYIDSGGGAGIPEAVTTINGTAYCKVHAIDL